MVKDLKKRKLYLIIKTDLKSKLLVIFNIKIVARFDGVTYLKKLENKFEGIKKARSYKIAWLYNLIDNFKK